MVDIYNFIDIKDVLNVLILGKCLFDVFYIYYLIIFYLLFILW